jgi:hypothetical protein
MLSRRGFFRRAAAASLALAAVPFSRKAWESLLGVNREAARRNLLQRQFTCAPTRPLHEWTDRKANPLERQFYEFDLPRLSEWPMAAEVQVNEAMDRA